LDLPGHREAPFTIPRLSTRTVREKVSTSDVFERPYERGIRDINLSAAIRHFKNVQDIERIRALSLTIHVGEMTLEDLEEMRANVVRYKKIGINEADGMSLAEVCTTMETEMEERSDETTESLIESMVSFPEEKRGKAYHQMVSRLSPEVQAEFAARMKKKVEERLPALKLAARAVKSEIDFRPSLSTIGPTLIERVQETIREELSQATGKKKKGKQTSGERGRPVKVKAELENLYRNLLKRYSEFIPPKGQRINKAKFIKSLDGLKDLSDLATLAGKVLSVETLNAAISWEDRQPDARK
jgi:hypothetical protein